MKLLWIRFIAWWPCLRTPYLATLWTCQHVAYRLTNPRQRCYFPWWVEFTPARLRDQHRGNVATAERLVLDWWKEILT